jgi:hypothetical protein
MLSWKILDRSRISFTLLGLSFCAVILYARLALQERQAVDTTRIQEVLLVPPANVLKVVDLGYHSLVADLLFIRANLYYGQKILADQEMPFLQDFIDTLLQMDPDFTKAYFWGAMVTTYYRRQISEVPQELIARANRILELGMNRFPDDYRFPFRIAFNLYYERGDADASLPYFERAASLPKAPSWIKEKLVDLYTRAGSRELARETLTNLIAEESDKNLSRALRERMEYLMENRERTALLESKKSLTKEWEKSYPYLPFELYLWIREP